MYACERSGRENVDSPAITEPIDLLGIVDSDLDSSAGYHRQLRGVKVPQSVSLCTTEQPFTVKCHVRV